MEEMNVSNAVEEVVEPQIDGNIEATEEVNENVEPVEGAEESVTEEVTEPQQAEKPVQSAEQNALFAKIRREAEAKAEARARDAVIADMGMEWNGKPIRTYQEYQQALKEKQFQEEAQNQGVDPEFYVEFKNMQQELQASKRNAMITQQDIELANDPVKGSLYNNWKDDVKQMAEAYNVDLKTAFSVVLEERLSEVLEMNQKKIQQETISKINTNQKSSVGALGAANDQPSVNAWDMSEADFNKQLERAMRGDLKRY